MMQLQIAIAWCLAWGDHLEPQVDRDTLHQMRQAMLRGESVPEAVRSYVEQARQLDQLDYPQSLDELARLPETHPQLWQSKIGLVYGGATKIKQYVFEASKLQDIRGASALLDRINLVDLPAFFDQPSESKTFNQQFTKAREWLAGNTPVNATQNLLDALIPELIIYSTGGNILAFCPIAHADDLANAIEKRYTYETLTANSCAVAGSFRFLELRLGRLQDPIEQTKWQEWYREHASADLVKAYYGEPEGQSKSDLAKQFERHRSFNELVRTLANRFNQRRSGYDRADENRPSRRYPPMFETHPYVRRDEGDRRSAVRQITQLPNDPWFSDALARKRIAGQKAKRERQSTTWYDPSQWMDWQPGDFDSWVTRFEDFLNLEQHATLAAKYNPTHQPLEEASKEARSLREIANVSKGFVAYIYADGNNMGGYIQGIKTAQAYQHFSDVVSKATEQSVYYALAHHLHPHRLHDIDDGETQDRDGKWIHPFEILTIGGDDVMLVVPADQALAIAKTLCEAFERILLKLDPSLQIKPEKRSTQPAAIHRYCSEAKVTQCELSMSAGVLITADNTPIYYAETLTGQLLKSAKKKAKDLKALRYYGGTIDFLVMKAVTMLSSKVADFREAGLVFGDQPKLKLYGAPYTLHEIGGLLKTAQALKDADFPRSQLYQIRSLLERGKHTAMLNYRYFRVRLAKDKQTLLEENFETAWCQPKDSRNGGNLAPWMSLKDENGTTYETIWRELIDLYPFVETAQKTTDLSDTTAATTATEVQ